MGFFYRNIEGLLGNSNVERLLCFDWLGMGGSERISCRASPRMPLIPCCDSKLSTSEAVGFFIDPLEDWLRYQNLSNVTLVGHSLGGYLSMRYVVKYPGRIDKLVLASPVGFPSVPVDSLPRGQMPLGLKLLDTLWSKNFTPQQIVRFLGGVQGKKAVKRVLKARLGQSISDHEAEILGDYFYHITCAKASGEYAMNSLLKPVATSRSAHVYAREDLETLALTGDSFGLSSFRVMFGDHDWMRQGEPSARTVSKYLNERHGLDTSVSILNNAGHHLYMDNPQEFHTTILS